MLKILLVGIGGFFGSILRYLVSVGIQRIVSHTWLPYGTMTVNILGCLLIGFLGGLAEVRQIISIETRLLLMVGFLGGFTTFSSFEFELFALARNSEFPALLVNLGIQLLCGFGAVWLGHALAKML
jgi:fluoride exporter